MAELPDKSEEVTVGGAEGLATEGDDPAFQASTPVAQAGIASSSEPGPGDPTAVVGLGASAGGVSVLQHFFSEMKPNSDLAFVVVMHLSPEHESNLAKIIQQK